MSNLRLANGTRNNNILEIPICLWALWFHRSLGISWGNTASWLRIYPVKISSFNLWNQHVINNARAREAKSER